MAYKTICCLIVFLASWMLPTRAAAQSDDKAATIYTQSGGGECNPQRGELSGYYSSGCCGSPGRGLCALDLHGGKGYLGLSAGCTDPNLNQVSNDTCQLPTANPEQVNLLNYARGFNPTDFTFYVTSDLHFFRSTYSVTSQGQHPGALNRFASTGRTWPLNVVGIPVVGANWPTAVVVPGDLTTGADFYKLQAYRLTWESGWIGDSILFPVYFGLGNHDASSLPNNFGTNASNGLMMREYLYDRLGPFNGTGMDTTPNGCVVGFLGCKDFGPAFGSLNYSWTWQGVHMVMLNTWAGDKNLAFAAGSDGLTWLANDLLFNVGTTGAPVILFQHYTLGDVHSDNDSNGNNQETRVEWTTSDYHKFWSIIQPYNVIGFFSGHTHALQLETTAASGNINPADDRTGPNPLGGYFENFVDGSGGDCGSDNCGAESATPNFFIVHVTDHYLDIGSVAWSTQINNGIPFYNNSFSYGTLKNGLSTASSAVCRKRISTVPFHDLGPSSLALNDTATAVTVTAPATAPLRGPLALQFPNSPITYKVGNTTQIETQADTLSSYDFADACQSGIGNEYLMVSETDIPAGQSITIPIPASSSVPQAPRLVQLADFLNASISSLQLGTATVPFQLSTQNGRHVNISWTVHGASQVTLTADSNNTPATLTIHPNGQGAVQGASIVITTDDPSINAITIPFTVGDDVAFTSNVAGGIMSINGNFVSLPANYSMPPGTQVTVNVANYFASPGVAYSFQSWSDGGPQQHTVTVGQNGLNLEAFFTVRYQLTVSAGPGGTIDPPSQQILSGSVFTLTATPSPGYKFDHFSGGISGTDPVQSITMNQPLTIVANFTQKTIPTVAWATPAEILLGSALSSAQLNATANVPGAFAYFPAAGTVLGAGPHTLTVSFTPTDTNSYQSTSATVQLQVDPTGVSSLTVTKSLTKNAAANYDLLVLTFTNTGVGTASTWF